MNNKMIVKSCLDDSVVYEQAIELIKKEVDGQEKTIGFATGGTMIPLYNLLKFNPIDFKRVIAFNLDEYVGLPLHHESSFQEYMNRQLYDFKRFKKTYIPNGNAIDLHQEAADYEHLVEKYQIDLQVLGVGVNGHIGFNEPGTSFSSKTNLVELTSSTRMENAKYFRENEAPFLAITMGIQTILSAKQIVLIAMGENKRAPLETLLSGAIDENSPITALNLHRNVIVLSNLSL